MPLVLSSRGWAAWLETEADGARFALGEEVELSTRAAGGPLRVHLFCAPTPAARLRDYLRATGAPGVAARVGLRALEEPRRLRAPARRRGRPRRLPRAPPPARRDRARLAVGHAIQHVGVQPAPVPGRAGDARPAARARRADRGVGHAVGQPRLLRRPAPARRRVGATAPRAGVQLRRGAAGGHFVRGRRRRAARRALVDGHGLAGRLHLAGRRGVVARAGQRVLAMGVQGIKADDGEGFYYPDDVRFADGRPAPQAAWGMGLRYRRSMQRALDEVAPGRRRAVRPARLDRPPGVGVTWGATRRRTSGRCARSSRRR